MDTKLCSKKKRKTFEEQKDTALSGKLIKNHPVGAHLGEAFIELREVYKTKKELPYENGKRKHEIQREKIESNLREFGWLEGINNLAPETHNGHDPFCFMHKINEDGSCFLAGFTTPNLILNARRGRGGDNLAFSSVLAQTDLELGLGIDNARFIAGPLEVGLGIRNPRFVASLFELGLGTRSPRFVVWPIELGVGTLNARSTVIKVWYRFCVALLWIAGWFT